MTQKEHIASQIAGMSVQHAKLGSYNLNVLKSQVLPSSGNYLLDEAGGGLVITWCLRRRQKRKCRWRLEQFLSLVFFNKYIEFLKLR